MGIAMATHCPYEGEIAVFCFMVAAYNHRIHEAAEKQQSLLAWKAIAVFYTAALVFAFAYYLLTEVHIK